ncbi:circularly permuted type 2 ATP-grasp protein [Roseomonas sp. OT10]|uniref:circularly permuted type 2 ATP-grasp protein n=1 Tax=Roseomonas cutis TaxID=2897332 RepID=UPI001E30EE2B|nr:circularly permuted type 2 ATP-grasp protein [Roseomonas sp. OT10]UFN51126.1 circularly permuted type 2 ATP-grasp protein [Roseomonas sp. OT10]
MTRPVDEMVDGHGRVRAHWRGVLAALASLPEGELADRALRLDRALEEEGITALLPSEERVSAAWRCDPVPFPIAGTEFALLEQGLAQRAALLEAILADLYGPMALLAEGLLPAELVFANPGFLRPARSADRPPRLPLIQAAAADLRRGSDGHWHVATDSTGRMAGLAQVLGNRRFLARLVPELFRNTPLRPLRPFLEVWQDALRRAAPEGREGDGIALLTPGVGDPTWAENVVLARELGCTPVEPGDLTVRGGDVYLKTLRGLQPIAVLLRRMESRLLDPLEFGASAAQGVVGLMDAVRNGTVRVVNDPGAGAVEAPALAAFLPVLCRRLLGEELRLPSLRTLWLGTPGALAEAEAEPERWVLRDATDPRARTVRLDKADAALRARVAARPAGWAVTRLEPPSLAPCWTGGGKQPCPISLRLFLMQDGTAWRVLPGGLAHVVEEGAPLLGRLPSAGLAKDVWVLEEERGETVGPTAPAPLSGRRYVRAAADLPSRAGDNLFWLGRYVERLDDAARLARAALQRLERDALLPHELAELAALARCLIPAGLATEEDAPVGGQTAPLRAALLRAAKPGGALPNAFQRIARLVDATRDRQTSEMHDAFVTPLREMQAALKEMRDPSSLSRLLGAALRYGAMVAGVAAENMVRGGAHTFLDLGRRVERAQSIASALALALDQPPARQEAGLRLALELCDSVITYRTRHLNAPQSGLVLQLVLADGGNPRGLGFQLARMRGLLEHVAGGPDTLSDEAGLLLSETISIAQADGPNAPARLRGVCEGCGNLASAISRRYFTLLAPVHTLGPEPAVTPLRGAA